MWFFLLIAGLLLPKAWITHRKSVRAHHILFLFFFFFFFWRKLIPSNFLSCYCEKLKRDGDCCCCHQRVHQQHWERDFSRGHAVVVSRNNILSRNTDSLFWAFLCVCLAEDAATDLWTIHGYGRRLSKCMRERGREEGVGYCIIQQNHNQWDWHGTVQSCIWWGHTIALEGNTELSCKSLSPVCPDAECPWKTWLFSK